MPFKGSRLACRPVGSWTFLGGWCHSQPGLVLVSILLSASYPQLRWSLTLFNLLKLPNGDSVVVTVHGFLGKDETVDIQNPATSERQLHFDTLAQNGVKVSNAKNLTEAIHDPQIGFQVQVLQ